MMVVVVVLKPVTCFVKDVKLNDHDGGSGSGGGRFAFYCLCV